MTRLQYRLPAPAARAQRDDAKATVVVTGREAELEKVGADVQAVVFVPPSPPPWLANLTEAVESGRLRFERTVLACATATGIDAWFEVSDVAVVPRPPLVGGSDQSRRPPSSPVAAGGRR